MISAMPSLRHNLELKARHSDLAAARAAAVALGANPGEVEEQADTYFHVKHGRLKLREIAGQAAVLIAYDRPNERTARLSAYHLIPITDPAALKAGLTATLGIRGEVRKRREILLWHNVRIHLDAVAGLGTFIEFEAVLSPADDEVTAGARLAQLGAALGVQPADHLAPSYADLLGFG